MIFRAKKKSEMPTQFLPAKLIGYICISLVSKAYLAGCINWTDVDVGDKWNFVDKTLRGYIWYRFTNKLYKNYAYISLNMDII